MSPAKKDELQSLRHELASLHGLIAAVCVKIGRVPAETKELNINQARVQTVRDWVKEK